jgi:hypothetical protein
MELAIFSTMLRTVQTGALGALEVSELWAQVAKATPSELSTDSSAAGAFSIRNSY